MAYSNLYKSFSCERAPLLHATAYVTLVSAFGSAGENFARWYLGLFAPEKPFSPLPNDSVKAPFQPLLLSST
jgi:hypothetical protein